ncbi:hypothetical protein IC617_15175 [Neiella sp. HB171785]|uniref:Uncharacterized protein n=1 Tax=Neiella litorisoli TaxID=2771431 RepID=A0A8J6QV22_9GAMM|nr:hypothetical protein [Neiella litorisoli]MBD1390772.1 hypothetical protein [Neiella litorisoli]
MTNPTARQTTQQTRPARRLTAAWLVTCCSLLMPMTAISCDNHGPGFGFYPMNKHLKSASDLSSPIAQGMALASKPRYTVAVGVTSEVPYTVIVPESFSDAKVLWQADDTVNLSGAYDQAIAPATDAELVLTVAPTKAGTYVVRGKLSGTLGGEQDSQSASKSAFILIKAVGEDGNLAKTTN